MPNWVVNKLEIIGTEYQVSSLLDKVKSEKSEFDFSQIVPMPKSLSIESSSNSDKSLALYKYEKDKDDSGLVDYLSYPWVINMNIKTVDELYIHLIKDGYDRELGKTAYENIENYGYKNWYDWSIENWGTKWNSSEPYISDNIIEFQTAWSTPFPIIESLSIQYPDMSFIVNYADEDIGSNCGMYELKNGKIIQDEKGDLVFACNVWGYDPADFDESYRRDRDIDILLNENEY